MNMTRSTTTSLISRNLIRGLTSFQRFLNQERATLAATPILLLDTTSSKSSTSSIQQLQLLCTSLGLRTTTAHPNSQHFPSVEDIPHTIEFAKRIGAATVVGVGSSSAIDLAKTITQHHQAIETLILVPETPAAALFATASHSLLVDPQETVMLPKPDKNTPLRQELAHLLVVLPEKGLLAQTPNKFNSALYAGLVLTLDVLYRGINEKETIDKIEHISSLIDQFNNNNGFLNQDLEADLQDLLLWSGSHLSFGLDSECILNPRSIPLALASSLVPTAFPEYQILDFVSGLLPGVVTLLQEHPQHSDLALQIYHKLNSRCPRLSQSEGHQLNMNALLSLIRDDGARWNCVDFDELVLEQVLNASLDL